MTPEAPARSISPPTSQPGSPHQPIHGGNTTPGRISMTNGHQLTSAKRRPDNTILVHILAWRLSGRRHGSLDLLSRLGPRRQTKATTRPGEPEHREVAARALAPLLPPEQQALVGAFPSPVVVSVSAAAKETSS